jgi:hypothetical protein
MRACATAEACIESTIASIIAEVHGVPRLCLSNIDFTAVERGPGSFTIEHRLGDVQATMKWATFDPPWACEFTVILTQHRALQGATMYAATTRSHEVYFAYWRLVIQDDSVRQQVARIVDLHLKRLRVALRDVD